MPSSELDIIRPLIDEDNTRKLREWEKILWERHRVRIASNRLINIILESIEFVEIEQTIRLGIKETEEKGQPPAKRKRRLIIKTTLGKSF